MFYVYHTGNVEETESLNRVEADRRHKQVHLIDRDKLAKYVVKMGLTEWLMDRTRNIA